MALIEEIDFLGNLEGNVYIPVRRCECKTFDTLDGRQYLQINTFGSRDREAGNETKISQSIQLGPEGIAQLRAILAQLD